MIEVSIYYPTGRIVAEQGDPLVHSSDKVRIEFVLPKRPLLFWAEYNIAESLQFPKGFGMAYYDPCRARVLYAPMLLNLLVGLLIWCYQWTRTGFAYWLFKTSKFCQKNKIR